MRMKHIYILLLLGITMMLSSCYHRYNSHQQHAALIEYSNKQLDSISFSTTHHYTNKFNFMVFKDSLVLVKQQPEELMSELPVDSFAVKKDRLLVVTDIRMVPKDSIDSVWVQLATEDNTFGWTRESKMLQQVVPADPISEFIMTFSNVHLLIFMVIIVVIAIAITTIMTMKMSKCTLLNVMINSDIGSAGTTCCSIFDSRVQPNVLSSVAS